MQTASSETRQLTDVDRVLHAIFGSPVSQKFRAPDWLIGRETDPSRTLIKFLEKWGACRTAASSFNHLLRPSQWTLDGRYAVFATENQGVCRWAINLKSSRPLVFQQPSGSTEWFREPSELLPFLVTFCFWNAVNGGLKHCLVADEPASLRDFEKEFTVVDSRLGRFDRRTRLYFADGAAVFCSKAQTGWQLHAGFRSRRTAEQFEKRFVPAS
jgi:hypothetical protein